VSERNDGVGWSGFHANRMFSVCAMTVEIIAEREKKTLNCKL